jgi:hypothetical protein
MFAAPESGQSLSINLHVAEFSTLMDKGRPSCYKLNL